MRGRRPGRPTKKVKASVEQWLDINRTGIMFQVKGKWKRNKKTVGTLTVSVGGLRWKPANGKYTRWWNWNEVDAWLTGPG